jgi:integrase
MTDDSNIFLSEQKLAAIALLDHLDLKSGDGNEVIKISRSDGRVDEAHPAQDILQDYLVEHDFKPSGVTSAAFSLLKGELPVLLSEAFSVYLDNHQKGKDKAFIAAQQQHWDKLVNLIGDMPIKDVTRKQARQYRDVRLETGVAPSTVSREIGVIRAIFEKAIRELSLGIANEFSSIEVAGSNRNQLDRLPYTKSEIQLLVEQSRAIDDEQRRIVTVLAFTGARLAEIVGLRKCDVNLDTKSILIQEHGARSLKNSHSKREIPLLPLALEAVAKQIQDAKGDFLFPRYASDAATNADSASATLNKWSKGLVPVKTMHCFRHAMRDLLRSVMCPESVAKEIGGWSSTNDQSVHYGQGYPLDAKRDWLVKAYAEIS